MDYFDSEVTESLDFLSPPVKRILYRNTDRERVYQPNNAFNQHNRLLRDFRTTVAKQTRTQLPVERPDGPSSTSLVLRRTTEREILEQYSVLSYTNLQYSNHNIKPQTISPPDKERPLIKVTVIPNNSEESQTAKLRKRRHKTNKVKSTVSNQENSIKAKNVYLVVAGRKREKIYEIKTTGSAEFPNNLNFKDGDATIEQVTQFKQLISSLNMDKKKKKAKKKDVAQKDSVTSLVKQVLEGPDPVFRDCSCFNDVPSGSPKDVRLRKSRVRICGKIGVTEDDRYILKCAATVNDKPAESSNMQRSFVQCRNGRCQQDTNIQADFRNKKCTKSQEIHHMRSKETQCTQCPQDNFNTVCFSNIEKLQISSKKDQLVQCHCLQPSEDVVRYEYESETTKDSASPLVIISVYPKQDYSERVNDRSPVRNNSTRPSSKDTNIYNMNANQRVNNERPKPDNNTNKREIRPGTLSPSPPRSPTRSRSDNNQEKGRSRLDNNQEKVRSRLNDNQETATRKTMIYKETSPGTRYPSPPRSPTRSRFDNNQEKGRSRLDNNQEKVKSRLIDNQETATRMKTINKETSPGTHSLSPPRSPTRSRFDNNQEKKGISRLDNNQEKVKSRLNDNQETATRKTMIYKETSPGTSSPSPPISPTRSRFDNNQEKGRSRLDNNQEKVRSRLNDNQETATRKKMIYKETSPTNKNNTNKPEQGKPKPRQNVPQARPDNKRQTNVRTNETKYYSGQQVAAGTNTDHNLQKKALVDSYTQKLAAQTKQKKAMNWTAPKNDVSNVTINIDAENEFYDVLFHQSDLTTDLRVRKTVKNQGSQKGHGEDDHSASLENFFLISQEEPGTSISQIYLDEPSYQPDNVAMLDPVSRLKVRDSIEISHRREDRISICARSGKMPLSYKVYCSETNNEENRKFFAPIKHYRGDSCALPDPVQRDKEIRELLGIKTGRQNTTKAIEEESMSAIEDHSLHCFYQTTCEDTDFGSNIQDSMCSIYKLNPPCCCTIPRESDQTDSIKSGQSGTSQQNRINQKPLTAAKKQTVSKVKDSNLPESDESKQIEQKLSKTSKKHKTKSITTYSDQSDSDDSKEKPEDSGESDSDESKQKPNDSDKTDSDESKQKPIDSGQSDSEKQKIRNIKSLLGSLKKRLSSKPKDSDQTDTDEPKKNDQKTSNSLKKRKTNKPKDSDQVDSDDSNKKPTESDQSDSDDSKQQLKQSDESDSDDSKQKPIDSDQSDYDEPQKIDLKTSNYLKKRKITTPTDSDQSYSEELKQTPKDTDEPDTDEPSKKNRDLESSIQKSSKRKDSDQSVMSCCCGDDHRKIDRTPPHSLKRRKSSKPKSSDESDSDDQRKIDRTSPHSLKRGKSSKSKRSDESDSDDQRKIDRSSIQFLKKRQISGKHEKSEPRDSVESKVINDKYGGSANKTQPNKNNFYETDSDKYLKSKSRHKSLYKPYAVDQAPLYQQLILNRNINVYLQIEQFTKQKPIVLSRKQYNKVKKTIENASTKRTKMCICTKSSSISLGEVRKKPKTIPTHYHKSIQSEADAKLNIKEQNKLDKIVETTKEKIVKDEIKEHMSKEDSKEKAKEKEMEKAREKEMEKEKERAREKEKEMEKAREKEMVIEKERAKEKEKEMEKTMEKEMEKEKATEREKAKEKEKGKAKEIEETKEKTKRKEKECVKEKGKEKWKKGKITIKCCNYCGKAQPAVPLCCENCGKKKNKGCYNCGRPLYYVGDVCPSYSDFPSYNDCYYCGVDQDKTVVLYKGKFKKLDEPVNINNNAKSSGHAASSVEIRYTSVACMKHVTFSSTKVVEKTAIPLTSNIAKKNSYHSDSLYTIFKGHRKTPTPNLGTSACSLYSEYSDARSPEPQDLKARKPFLKRLISCLVMRTKASQMKIEQPVPKMTSVNSSVDSYHFSTSLGAIELTSSMYDTSASFYSNHTILPMNSRMKRGFFSSVRGFLTTNRRS